jgi:hypothetical protein
MTEEKYQYATCNSCGYHAPESKFGELGTGSSGLCPCCGSKNTMFCDEPTRAGYLAGREAFVERMKDGLMAKVVQGVETKEGAQRLVRFFRKSVLSGIYTPAERFARRTRPSTRRSPSAAPAPPASGPPRSARPKSASCA